jgi:hypothetical protein
MSALFRVLLTTSGVLVITGNLLAQNSAPGTEEFGLTSKELVQAVEKVELLIARCMHEQGFEYVAADFATVHRGMSADKKLANMDEEEFAAEYGFGLATLYTGAAPQLVEGYSPGRVGLGDRNVQIFKSLSPSDQAAYNRALLGENTDATFAVALETENFSRCGGCTRRAIEQVFRSEQLQSTYQNPLDALISRDPRMKAALRKYAEAMHEAGFDYTHPDEVEPDVMQRLNAITDGRRIPVDQLSPEQSIALKKLQAYERRLGILTLNLEKKYFEPVEEKIEEEMYARDVN